MDCQLNDHLGSGSRGKKTWIRSCAFYFAETKENLPSAAFNRSGEARDARNRPKIKGRSFLEELTLEHRHSSYTVVSRENNNLRVKYTTPGREWQLSGDVTLRIRRRNAADVE